MVIVTGKTVQAHDNVDDTPIVHHQIDRLSNDMNENGIIHTITYNKIIHVCFNDLKNLFYVTDISGFTTLNKTTDSPISTIIVRIFNQK